MARYLRDIDRSRNLFIFIIVIYTFKPLLFHQNARLLLSSQNKKCALLARKQ